MYMVLFTPLFPVAHASTVVDADIDSNQTWDASGSPYIIDQDMTISGGVVLTIGQGTQVFLQGHALFASGSIDAEGSSEVPVYVDGGGIFLTPSGSTMNSYFDHVHFATTSVSQYGGSLVVSNSAFDGGVNAIQSRSASTTVVYTSIVNQAGDGLYVQDGSLVADHDDIEDNGIGLVFAHKPVLADIFRSIFYTKQAFADSNTYHFTISTSTILNNMKYGISNLMADQTIDARNNWWGGIGGPGSSTAGSILVSPWLLEKPEKEDLKATPCCSSVLFLPGIEASRLYAPGTLFENQLWEPNRNADVQKLYLDQNGKSIRKDVYTRDILDQTNITGSVFSIPIYKSFINTMNTLVASGTIAAWKPLPYDWRLSLDDIIASTSVLELIKSMASASKTGTVTIVAHSNGGLLAKQIVKDLQGLHQENIVDKIIFVASPHLGTPESLSSLLYGDGQDILHGLILSKSTASALARNMPAAYNLLPSAAYFAATDTPLIIGTTTTVSSEASLDDFLKSQNQYLLKNANSLHQNLDSWTPPPNMGVYQIVGEGEETPSGIAYKTTTAHGATFEDHSIVFSTDGDGIVMKTSAIGSFASTTYAVDISSENKKLDTNYNHANILEFPSVKSCFITLLASSSCSSLNQIEIYDSGSHVGHDADIIGIHSPATVYAVDGEGRQTGPIDAPADDDLQWVKEDIPNSSYYESGEGKYIVLQDQENPSAMSVVLNGTGVGTFTLSFSLDSDSSNPHEIDFEDVPITPDTQAKVSLSDPHELTIDFNGDGIIDATTTDTSSFDPALYIQSIESLLNDLPISKSAKSTLVQRLNKLLVVIQKNKSAEVKRKIYGFIRTVNFHKKGLKKLTSDEQQEILTLIQNLADALEQMK